MLFVAMAVTTVFLNMVFDFNFDFCSVAPFNSMKDRDPNAANEYPGKQLQPSKVHVETFMFVMSRSGNLRPGEGQSSRNGERHDEQLILHQDTSILSHGPRLQQLQATVLLDESRSGHPLQQLEVHGTQSRPRQVP